MSSLISVCPSRSALFRKNPVYKPFAYPWAYVAWNTQQRLHWLPDEVPMADDIKDWKEMAPSELNLLTQIFRFFTQMDVEVGCCYLNYYTQILEPTEIKMMLCSFANMETIHVAAYAHLLDSLGVPEIEYQAFLQYKAMKDKWDYMQTFKKDRSIYGLAVTIAAYGAFTEGLQLFASFAMLLNFPRHNKMRGMGQIVTWSVRDETLHIHSMLKLFETLLEEFPEVKTPQLHRDILSIAQTMVEHEDAFIRLAFEMGDMQDLTAQEMHTYIRYIADRRLVQLGLDPFYGVSTNPLPWMDDMLAGQEHANFFEARSTEYSKGATHGTWEDVFPVLLSS